MKRLLAVMVGVLLLLSAPAVASTAVSGNTSARNPGQPCVWQQRYETTLADLGADPDNWLVSDPGLEAWGRTFATGWVAVDPAIPCRYVDDVVRHEWMHLRMIDTPVDEQPDELIADCGSWLLGSTITPYRDELRQVFHTEPCTGDVLATARELAATARDPASTARPFRP